MIASPLRLRLRVLPAIVLALALFPLSAAAQFRSVFSRNGTDVIAVGDSGLVFRSVDGGATWMDQHLGARPLWGVAARGWTILAAGDSGKVWRSTDSGYGWALAVLPGIPDLRSMSWPSPDSVFVAGKAGVVLLSADGGSSWSAQSSGSAAEIRRVRFHDAHEGWMVGSGGFAAHTTNGGANWITVAVPTTRDLYDVDFVGGTVWAVGEAGVALRSTSAGASWTAINLRLDAGSPVNAVWLASADSVTLSGGGGFIRRSANGGATWTFATHSLQAPVASLFFAGPRGWLASPRTRAILRTADGGATWSLPTGTTQLRLWTLKFTGALSVRGATFALNPVDHKTLYCMLSAKLYRSRNDGESWDSVGIVPGINTLKTNAFLISPKDTNVMVAAVGNPDRIVRSTDGGVSWTTQHTMDFGEYGIPLEMHPDNTDTLYFGPDNGPLYISTDFGISWSPWSTTVFRSPCDILAVPENDSGVVIVADGVTSSGVGEILRSNDHGVHFVKTFSPSPPPAPGSEIPGLSMSRLNTAVLFATAWSGGTLKRSVNQGLSFSIANTSSQTWGTDIAKDDPNCVLFGTYSFNNAYLAFDGGAGAWTYAGPVGGANYAYYCRDRALMFAEQSNGIHKLSVRDSFAINLSSSVTVAAPNGGEVWAGNSQHVISWSATRVALVRIEWRKSSSDPWQTVALVDGSAGAYNWTVPAIATTDAWVRVSDAWDGAPVDASNAAFTIQAPGLLASPDPMDLGTVSMNAVRRDTLHLENTGTATLVISAVASDDANFWAGRSTLILAPGASDTLGIFFDPSVAGPDTATLTLTTNDAFSPHAVLLVGNGSGTVGVEGGTPLAFGLWQNQPNPFTFRTSIRYALPRRADVSLEVFDLQGHRVATLARGEQPPGLYTVPFGADALDVDGRALSRLGSGVYFYRFRAGPFSASRKMLLMR